MSYDPYSQSAGFIPPKKDNTLKIVLIALGCFGFLVLSCVGGVAFLGYQGFQLVEKSIEMINDNPAYHEAREKIKNSEALGEVMGEPIEVGTYSDVDSNQDSVEQGFMRIVYTVPVSGPNANGTATVVVEGKPFGDEWDLKSTTVFVNGEEVPLDDEGSEVGVEGE